MMKPLYLAMTLLTLSLSACGGGSLMQSGSSGAMTQTPPALPAAANVAQSSAVDRDTTSDLSSADDMRTALTSLKTIVTIGSTIDPINGDQNPYGLDVAKSDNGPIQRGDLVVCNFNNAANVQGTGSTIVALHAHAGAVPTHIAQDQSLLGCNALALAPNDNIWNAAFAANDNPIVSPPGAVVTTLGNGPWNRPFGQTFAQREDGPAFYASNAGDGSIVRITIAPGPKFGFEVIATGFAINGGAPGSILGPSGLQYDARNDRLWIVDGANNSIVAFRHVSTIPAGGIAVSGSAFSGPFAHRARTVFSGAPLNGPISSALLPNGNVVVGNTLDPNGQNIMVEITPHGRIIATRNVDTGNAGALFGMVATGEGMDDLRLYFNDDNANTVEVLTR